MGEAEGIHQRHGLPQLLSGVAAADGPQHMVLHGLGVHRQAVHPVGFQDGELLGGDGVGPSGLHGDLVAPGAVEGLFKGGEHPVHLVRGQRGGGAAAHVERPHPQALTAHHLAAGADLGNEGVHIGLHQRKAVFHRLAHKGTVGAAGGTKRDAHIHGDVPLSKTRRGFHRRRAGLHGQSCPLGCNEVLLLQKRPGLVGGLPLLQCPGDGLVGPHAGEHAPGGRDAGDSPGCQEKAPGDGVAALALPLKVRAREGGAEAVGR